MIVSLSTNSRPCGPCKRDDENSVTSVTVTYGRPSISMLTSAIAIALRSKPARANRCPSGENATSSVRPNCLRAVRTAGEASNAISNPFDAHSSSTPPAPPRCRNDTSLRAVGYRTPRSRPAPGRDHGTTTRNYYATPLRVNGASSRRGTYCSTRRRSAVSGDKAERGDDAVSSPAGLRRRLQSSVGWARRGFRNHCAPL